MFILKFNCVKAPMSLVDSSITAAIVYCLVSDEL